MNGCGEMFEGDVLNSRFYSVCEAIINLIGLTCLLIIFSLPIVTIGSSMTAFIASLRQPEYKALEIFVKEFKANFLRSAVNYIFSIFSIMFMMQIRYLTIGLVAGNIIYFVILAFVIAYNINLYVLISIIKKSNLTFFRQAFFFTLATFYKGFFLPIIGAALLVISPIIGGIPLLLMSLGIIVKIYLKMIKKDLIEVCEYI